MIYSIPKHQSLKNELHLFSRAFEETQALSKIGSWDWDVQTNEVRWSEMMFMLLGLELNESIPTYNLALSHVHTDDKDEYEKTLELAMYNKKPYYFENRIIKKGGAVIPVISRGECIIDENGDLVRMMGTVQDVSERKEIEKINQEKIAAEERDRIKSTILTVISHDLKSPFLSLNYLSDMIAQEIEKKNIEKTIEYADHIKNISKQSYDLLVNLLDWSLCQTDNVSFNPETMCFSALSEEQINFFQPLLIQKNVTISSTAESDLEIFCDKNMTLTVMRNLISNALKYSNDGGEIIIDSNKGNLYTTISITDNGVGIHPDILENIFKSDKIIRTKGTANEQGTGLGLTICKEFIRRHRGEIWVESEQGKGSTFHFTLPHN